MRGSGLFLLAFFFAAFPLGAEVYLLKPRPVFSQNVSLQQLPGISSRPLHTESVEINGMPLTLHFYASTASYREICAFAERHFSASGRSAESGTLRLCMKRPGHPEVRALVVGSVPGRPVTVIALELSRKLPAPVWPQELPALPAGAVPVQITRFPKRNALCGEFRFSAPSAQGHLRALASRLRAAGFQPGAAEYRHGIGGTGEVFIRFRPRREVLLVSFQEDGSGTFFLQEQP